jgi:hypothetical protein
MTTFFLVVGLFLLGLVGFVLNKIAKFVLYFILYGVIFYFIMKTVIGVL